MSETRGRQGGGEGVRGSYLAFTAHEVRNPLSTALWSAELLVRMARSERGGARGEKVAAMCLRALRRLQLLVEDHFLIERLETGGLAVRLAPLSLGEQVAAAVGRCPAGACAADELPEVLVAADESLLGRALDALLHAAGKGGAAVHLSASREAERITVQVRGAPPLESALADPGRGSDSDVQGHSLSLAMAKRVAQALGGELRVAGEEYLLTLQVHEAGRAPAGE